MPEHDASFPTTTPGQGQREARYALSALMALPDYPKRYCAPAPGNPAVCARDGATPTSLWCTPDEEAKGARHIRVLRAKAACARCPIRQACGQYAIDFEEWNVWGGLEANERRRIRQRRNAAATSVAAAAPVVSAKRSAVLLALAAHYAPAAVAAAAGMPEQTAAWQRARLVTVLHLDPRAATRMDLLQAARTAGLLDPTVPLIPNPRVVAAVPGEQAAVERAQPHQLLLPGLPPDAVVAVARTARRLHRVPANASRPALAAGRGAGVLGVAA